MQGWIVIEKDDEENLEYLYEKFYFRPEEVKAFNSIELEGEKCLTLHMDTGMVSIQYDETIFEQLKKQIG